MREDVRQLADRLELERFLLCGHSMGGTVATLFAERYPNRLTGLVVVDTPPPDGRGEWKVPPQPEGELDFDWPVIPAIYGQLTEPDPAWWSDLPRISVPTLVVGGGSTSTVPQDLLAKVAELIPDAALTTVEGAAHTVQRTRPAELVAAVRSLLVRVEQLES